MKKMFLSLSLFLSFNLYSFERPPVLTIQGSTNYTIPAKKWARVVVTAWEGGSFAINSTQVLNTVQKTWGVLASSSIQGGGSWGAVNTSSAAGNALMFTSSIANMTTNISQYYYVRTGDILACTGNCRYHIEIYNL